MVSHHGDGPTSLALRGTASAVGASEGRRESGVRATASHVSSRSRRYNRSHAGGTSFVPQNEFPVFSHSGDVEIIVRVTSGHENRYLLHRHTLTRCSGFFEASTSNEWSRAQTVPENSPPSLLPPPTAGAIEGVKTGASQPDGQLTRIEDQGLTGSHDGGAVSKPPSTSLTPIKKRWRYELDFGSGGDDIPMLVQKEERGPPPTTNSLFGGPSPSNSSSRHHSSKSTSHSFFRSVANLSLSSSNHGPSLPPPTPAEEDLLRDYDNLFRIMYNYAPTLDPINIADAYIQCKSLLNLADQYDALAVVGPRVDHHMLQFQSRLWKQIAKYPISYLRLGYLARSKVIFQEALVHVVGQWPSGERSIRAAFPESVIDIIEDKVDELEETVSRIEARLFRLTLTNRSSGERVSPATNYLDWLAVSLFRTWLADNTTPPPPPPPPPPERSGRSSRGAITNGNSSSSGRHRNNSSSSSSSSAAGALVPSNSNSNSNHPPNSRNVHFHPPPPSLPPLASLGRTYRILGSGQNEKGYLTHDECKRFLKLTPDLYSRDNLRRFEKRIDELKAMAREVVRPLMGSGLELELQGGGAVGYLTCTRVGERDLPWVGGGGDGEV